MPTWHATLELPNLEVTGPQAETAAYHGLRFTRRDRDLGGQLEPVYDMGRVFLQGGGFLEIGTCYFSGIAPRCAFWYGYYRPPGVGTPEWLFKADLALFGQHTFELSKAADGFAWRFLVDGKLFKEFVNDKLGVLAMAGLEVFDEFTSVPDAAITGFDVLTSSGAWEGHSRFAPLALRVEPLGRGTHNLAAGKWTYGFGHSSANLPCSSSPPDEDFDGDIFMVQGRLLSSLPQAARDRELARIDAGLGVSDA